MSVTYTIVNALFSCYMLMLFARIISSWFPQIQGHPIIGFIAFYTDPYLNFFRRFIPPLGIFDLSPIVAFFALQFIEILVKSLLFQ